MKTTARQILVAGAALALLGLPVSSVLADSTTNAVTTDVNTNMGASAVDAGKLIDQNVYDTAGEKVGDIDSVIVDTNGKVTAVVLDVGGWLSSKKLVSVPWKDLQSSADGKITTNMTKEQAQAAADFKYKQEQARGKVQTSSGELYNSSGSNAAAGVTTTGQTASTATLGTPVRNTNGSLNASQVIGTKVVNDQNESIGKIGEIILSDNGKPSGVVVDVGGFLGIATHPVLLNWKQVKLVDKDGTTQAVVTMSKDELKEMPEYNTK